MAKARSPGAGRLPLRTNGKIIAGAQWTTPDRARRQTPMGQTVPAISAR